MTTTEEAPPGPRKVEPPGEEKLLRWRHPRGAGKWALALIAAAWSIFQLSLAEFVTLNSDYVRAIHLVFAMVLVYLGLPFGRRGRRDRIPILAIVLAVIAAICAGYYALDYSGIAQRQGAPNTVDIIVGIALLLLLLEAARRTLGPALPIIAVFFILYALFGRYAPSVFAFKGASLRRVIGQLTLSQEGVYGVPLRVSASTVFLFVLFGALLERAGGGAWFVQVAYSLLGRFRGGPAKAAVVASGLTGMVSGSCIANVVTTGTFTIPLMKRAGYPAEKAAAIEVAASTNGQLMPPIMGAAAFVMAEYCNVPYLTVVKAAFVPAVISYIALLYITHLEAVKLGLRPAPRETLPRFREVFPRGLHFLIPVVLLVGLLIRGYSPPVCAFYGIASLAALVLIRDVAYARRYGLSRRRGLWLGLRVLGGSLASGGRAMAPVAVACAAAGIIVGVVSLGLGHRIAEIVAFLSGGNVVLILLLTAVASLILGMGLPTTATYIVMASLTAEVIVQLAGAAGFVVPRLAAHLFCFFFGILADDTPPVGLAAYAGAAIAGSSPIRTGIQGFLYDLRTAVLPFAFILNPDLLLWNVHSPWAVIGVFTAGALGMMAFAAITVNHFRARNRVHESLLLALATALLLCPNGAVRLLGGPGAASGVMARPVLWGVIGVAVMAAVWALQGGRQRRAAPSRTT